MPEIFDKDSKLKVIEYGAHETGADIWNDLKTVIRDYIPESLHKFVA